MADVVHVDASPTLTPARQRLRGHALARAGRTGKHQRSPHRTSLIPTAGPTHACHHVTAHTPIAAEEDAAQSAFSAAAVECAMRTVMTAKPFGVIGRPSLLERWTKLGVSWLGR
jgi:hypothetical protein